MDKISEVSPFKDDTYSEYGAGSSKIASRKDDISEPVHRMISRGIFDRQRCLGDFIDSMESNRTTSIVSTIDPIGDISIDEIVQLHFIKYIQETSDSRVYISVSNDHSSGTVDMSTQETQDRTRDAVKDILAVGFDPDRTRIIVNIEDSSVVYPIATQVSKVMSQEQIKLVNDQTHNIGQTFYPAVQISNQLIPQLIYRSHTSLLIGKYRDDPYVDLTREVIDRLPVNLDKLGCLVSRDMPQVTVEDTTYSITTNTTPRDVEDQILKFASSASSLDREANELYNDTAYKLLYYFFEENDEKLINIYNSYLDGSMHPAEIKQYAISKINEFISAHNTRKSAIGSLESELDRFRLTKMERKSALTRVGYSTPLRID